MSFVAFRLAVSLPVMRAALTSPESRRMAAVLSLSKTRKTTLFGSPRESTSPLVPGAGCRMPGTRCSRRGAPDRTVLYESAQTVI